MSKSLRWFERLLGAVVLLTATLAPWMLGATTRETIWALNGLGFLSGGLWIVQRFVRSRASVDRPRSEKSVGARWPMACIWALVITLLGYVLCSALNPRASLQYTFTPGYTLATGVEIDYLEPVEWLPQSHDQDRTLKAFWKYLAIVLSFAAARHWLMSSSQCERRSYDGNTIFPGYRMMWLLWVLAVNSAVVSFVGILQRLDGTDKLLWLFKNYHNSGRGAFGPFPYRASGAQYLNLIWPVVLGFWWVLRRRNLAKKSAAHRSGRDPHVVLLPLVALTAAGVVVTSSRGGGVNLVGLLALVVVFVMLRSKRQAGVMLAVVAAALVVLGLGLWLGGDAMVARFRSEDMSTLNGRTLIYEDADRMAKDFAVFGSGAETFAPLYYFYRKKDPFWSAYAHDDYLETRITFGNVGFVVILLIFLAVWHVPFFGNGIPAPPEFIIMIGVAMLGILVHAKFDLPFQIYSIHSQFVLLCAVLTSLKWQRG
jgi:O-antigen ligase